LPAKACSALIGFLAETITRDAAQAAAVFAQVGGADFKAQVARQEIQHAAAQAAQHLLADHVFGELRLAGAQPGLLLQHGGVGGLLVQRHGVSVGQAHQLAPAEKCQQAAHAQREDEVEAPRSTA
jgi:hypothetical protein